MDICTDLGLIRSLSQSRRDENLSFRSWLENARLSDHRLEATVRTLALQAASAVDCLACHNCCLELRPQVSEQEIENLARRLGLSVEGFLRDHVGDAPLADRLLRRHTAGGGSDLGCSLLREGRCTAYDVRPRCCRDYPDLLRSGFRGRLWNVVENCRICPVVFSVYEELKRTLWPRCRHMTVD